MHLLLSNLKNQNHSFSIYHGSVTEPHPIVVAMDTQQPDEKPISRQGTKRSNEPEPSTASLKKVKSVNEHKRIVELRVPWPSCSYHESSKRNQIQLKSTPTLKTLIHLLSDWNQYPEIAIDGMAGMGKSTIITNMNRGYLKVNMIVPEITKGPAYNFNCAKSLAYLFTSQLSRGENVCWDRCRYSNLIFYFVHALMARFKDRPIPLLSQEVYEILGILAVTVNLSDIFQYCEIEKPVPTIVLVSSDFRIPIALMTYRGSTSDIFNSTRYNYLAAQYNVYCFFAKMLKYPLIDVADYISRSFSLSELYFVIRQMIDTPKDSPIKQSLVETKDIVQNLHNHMSCDNSLIFSRSNK